MNEPPRREGFQGYHRVRNAQEDAELTHVGPGTPCGEYLRRYWQPVAMSEELAALPRVWLQIYENTQDPIHVLHLHARSSGVQFGAASGIDQVIEYQDTPLGMMNVQTRQVGGHVWVRTVDSILPNGNQTGAIWEEAEAPKAFQRCAILRWMVPVDDTATRTIGWRFFSSGRPTCARRRRSSPPDARVSDHGQAFNFLISSTRAGITSLQSPTTPKRDDWKIAASGSELIETMALAAPQPAMCWPAPEIPTAR